VLVHSVQGQEEIDDPGVRNNIQFRFADADFRAVAAVVRVIPGAAADADVPHERIVVRVMVHAWYPTELAAVIEAQILREKYFHRNS